MMIMITAMIMINENVSSPSVMFENAFKNSTWKGLKEYSEIIVFPLSLE